MTTEHRISTPDGRALQVQEAGDPDGAPVLFHHGTPMSRLIYPPWGETAAREGVRFINFDRAGYGLSDRDEGRSVASVAADVRAIADGLGIGRLGIIGLSGGGPHVLASAALLADLVPRAVSLAAVAPYDAEGLDWFADTGESNVEETRKFLEDREAAWREWEEDAELMRTASAAELVDRYRSIYSPRDLEIIEGPLGDWANASTRAGLEVSIYGPWDDEHAFVSPWGFSVGDIAIPVRLRQGREDLMVPYAHGAWLAGQIPGVEALMSEEESHLSLMEHLGEDLAWLREGLL